VVGGGEGDVESVFDEEGLLFGDSEFSTARLPSNCVIVHPFMNSLISVAMVVFMNGN